MPESVKEAPKVSPEKIQSSISEPVQELENTLLNQGQVEAIKNLPEGVTGIGSLVGQ